MMKRADIWRLWLLRLVAACLATLIAFGASQWLPQVIDTPHLGLNLRAKLLAERPDHVSDDVSLVRISDAALIGRPYSIPLDRAYLAEVIAATATYGPRLILVDFVFDRPTEPKKDIRLIETLDRIPTPVALAFLEGRAGGATGKAVNARIAACKQALLSGTTRCRDFQDTFIARTVLMNPNKALRGYGFPTLFESKESDVPGFVASYIPQSEPGGPCSLSDLAVHPDLQCRSSQGRLIAWQLPPKDSSRIFPVVDSPALLGIARKGPQLSCDPKMPKPVLPTEASLEEKLRTEQLYCRVVIIGGDFLGQDRHYTPISGAVDGKGGQQGDVAGFEIQAQAAQQQIDGRIWYEFDKTAMLILLFCSALFGICLRMLPLATRETKALLYAFFFFLFLADIALFSLSRYAIPGLSIILPSASAGFACFVAVFLSFFIVEWGQYNLRGALGFLKEMLT